MCVRACVPSRIGKAGPTCCESLEIVRVCDRPGCRLHMLSLAQQHLESSQQHLSVFVAGRYRGFIAVLHIDFRLRPKTVDSKR